MGETISSGGSGGGGALADHTHSTTGDGGSVIVCTSMTSKVTTVLGENGVTGGSAKFWDQAGTGFACTIASPALGYTANRSITLPDIGGLVTLAGANASPATAGTIARVNVTGQTGNIASTILANATPAGLYDVSVYMETAVVGAAGNTVVLTIAWTDSVGAKTSTVTLDTATLSKQNPMLTIYKTSAASNITWSTVRTGGTYTVRLRGVWRG